MESKGRHVERIPDVLTELLASWSSSGPDLNDYWRGICENLIECSRSMPATSFLRWPAIKQTMHMTHRPEHDTYYQFLLEHDRWHDRWSLGLQETPVGGYIPYKLNITTSPQLVQHNFHLAYFMACAGVDPLQVDAVLEIGGGYGAMCRLFRNLGYQGRYTIYDLPMFTEIQRAWLLDVGIAVDTESEAAGDATVRLCSDAEAFAEQAKASSGKTLLISTWGVSEIPLGKREALLAEAGRCHAILFAFQEAFGSVNNMTAFNGFMGRHNDTFTWRGGPIPDKPGNFYLFGTRR